MDPGDLGAWAAAWGRSWRLTFHQEALLDNLLADGPVVLGFWHEHLAVLGLVHAHRGFVGMVSQSRDGERLTGILQALGYDTIRGSSSAGARGVARAALRALERGKSVAVALDGPRGPRRHAARGAVAIARWSGRPLLLVGCSVGLGVRLPSWDRQVLPLPLSSVAVRYRLAPARHVGRALSGLCVSGPSAP